MKQSDNLALPGDVLDSIHRIESYTTGVSKENFLENFMMQDAVMHQIEIIGEASNSISDEFQDQHPRLPWMQCGQFATKSSTTIAGLIYTLFEKQFKTICLP